MWTRAAGTRDVVDTINMQSSVNSSFIFTIHNSLHICITLYFNLSNMNIQALVENRVSGKHESLNLLAQSVCMCVCLTIAAVL